MSFFRRTEVRLAIGLGLLVIALAGPVPTLHSRAVTGRPVGGVVAVIDASGLETDIFNSQFCGGTLIGPDSVLTAAHCVVDRNVDDINVVIGADNLCRGGTVDGRRLKVARIDLHPMYSKLTGAFDLASLVLAEDAHDKTRSIVTPADIAGDRVTALGWGRASTYGAGTCRLTSVGLRLLSAERCETDLAPASGRKFDRTSMLCAIPIEEGVDTCAGDSGGPVFLGSATEWAPLVGVVSWGVECASGLPGVYARADAWRS